MPSADRRLQIKSTKRNDLSDFFAMCNELSLICVFHCRQAEQCDVIAAISNQCCFSDSLHCLAADASDSHERLGPSAIRRVYLVGH